MVGGLVIVVEGRVTEVEESGREVDKTVGLVVVPLELVTVAVVVLVFFLQ